MHITISSLPVEVLGEILLFLPIVDQLAASKVSKLWEAVISSPCLQRTRYTSLLGQDAKNEHPYGIHRFFASEEYKIRCTVDRKGEISKFKFESEDGENSFGIDVTEIPSFLDEKFFSPFAKDDVRKALARKLEKKERERLDDFKCMKGGMIQAMHYCKFEDPYKTRCLGFYPSWAAKEDVTNRELLQRLVRDRATKKDFVPEDSGYYFVDIHGDVDSEMQYLGESNWFLQIWVTMD
ncbi:hypothetical protein TWF694_007918 [Orbilia ellipsospora]|uniref:F-box domain-containing protein n=1 Tax=Orbilia ellipsospora TaxID=2528407 RepID=A0AAV9XJ87_9PEZI